MPKAPSIIVLVLSVLFTHSSVAQSVTTRIILSNLRAPWEIAWGGDGFIYMTEFNGRISRVDPDQQVQTVLLERVPDMYFFNEGGLLGMALAPGFPTPSEMYIAYTYREGVNTRVKVTRYNVEQDTLSNPTDIISNIIGAGVHNGCRLAFGNDGTLYITTGDAGQTSLPQNVQSLNGKVLRLNPDGTIPSDNPWGTEVWTLGHRNAQGLTFGPNNVLYSSEHGPTSDDEINIVERGRNYGWPHVEGFCNAPAEEKFCADSNVKEPIGIVWTPTIAPGQLIYYNGDRFPQWKHHLLLCGMKDRSIIALPLNESRTLVTGQSNIIKDTYGRTRAICQSPTGRIFFCSSNHDRYGDKRTNSDWLIEIVRTSDVVEESDNVQLLLNADILFVNGLPGRASVVISDTQGRTVWTGRADDSGYISTSLHTLATAPYLLWWQTAQGQHSRTFTKH